MRIVPLVVLVACGPVGPRYAASVAAEGPPIAVEPGVEITVPFAIELAPIGADDRRAPALEFGFDAAYTVTAAAPARVRFVTFSAEDDATVPTPWEVGAGPGDDATFAQSSAVHDCGRGEAACRVEYEVAVELRAGSAAEVAWEVTAWARGGEGSAERVSGATEIAVAFGEPE